MYARLWWKDLRQFWPIWLFLVVAAGAAQWLSLFFGGVDARQGALLIAAIFWTSLYAMTAGAAAFAGEREVGGLRLLDALPAPRRVVWSAKVSFAIVSSLALVLVLLAMAALATDALKPADTPVLASELVLFPSFILFALGWGLFFSSFTRSAITAAVLGIVVCCFTATLVTNRPGYWYFGDSPAFFSILVLGTTVATMAASALIFTVVPGPIRLPSRSWIQFRSPIVIDLPRPEQPVRVQLRSPITAVPAFIPRPAVIAGSSTPLGIRQYPRSWFVEYTAIAWQTLREGSRLWWLLFAVVGFSPVFLGVRSVGIDPSMLVVFDALGLLAAGVSVFGIEHQARSQRILAYHSARPRLVWLAKLSVWILGVIAIAVIQVILGVVWFSIHGSMFFHTRGPTDEEWYVLLGMMGVPFLPFAIAMLCGMTIRRTITAGVIALVFTLLIGGGCGGLIASGLFPMAGLVIIPLALLGITWAWAGDWMLDRPAPGRWLRLGGLVSGTFAVLFVWYIGSRAWGISDPGPVAPPASWSTDASILDSPDRNAAGLYRQAADLLRGDIPRFAATGGNQQRALELIRQATARPDCLFIDPRKKTITSERDLPRLSDFALIVNREVDEQMRKGDLAGAWASIMVGFRLARHEAQAMSTMWMMQALQIDQTALSKALEWSLDRHQTLELLRTAQKALRELPEMPAMADLKSANATILEQTLNLPSDDLKQALNQVFAEGHGGKPRFSDAAMIEISTTPWELTRIRRIVHRWAAESIQLARLSPLNRALMGRNNALWDFFQNPTPSPLVTQLLAPNFSLLEYSDRMLMGRRALVQVIAIRSWQLRHDGAFPERLDQLVPEDLESLPLDPYSETPFRYIVSSGQSFTSIGEAFAQQPVRYPPAHRDGTADWRLLFSVGPDLRDDHGNSYQGHGEWDYVFAIPPLETKPTAKK